MYKRQVYVLLQTPAGFLTDRFGPKMLLTVGCFLCCLGCYIFANATTFIIAEIGRLLMGGSLAFAFVGMVYITAMMLPSNIFTLMIGLAETLALIGVVASEMYLVHTLEILGWRIFITQCSIAAFILGCLCWFFFPSRAVMHDGVAQDALHIGDVFKQFCDLIFLPVAWANGAYAGLMFSVVTTFHGLWAHPFLMQAYHMPAEMATEFSSMMLIGAAIGFPFYGCLGGYLKNTQGCMALSAFLSGWLLLFILSVNDMPLILLAFCMISLGFCCASYVLCFAISHNIVTAGAKSTSIGFTNTLAVITAPLMQPFVGLLLEYITDADTVIQVQDYNLIDYQLALGVIVIGCFSAAVLACFLPSANRHAIE